MPGSEDACELQRYREESQGRERKERNALPEGCLAQGIFFMG